MTIRKTLLITGPNGSGKGTAAKYLHEKYGAVSYRFSSPLYQILTDMGLSTTRENLDILSRSLRDSFGQDIMGKGVRRFMEDHPEELIVLEGIRRASTMGEFAELVDIIIWIDASLDIRYARVSARGEKDGEISMSRERFYLQESLESEKNLTEFRDIADIIIDNNGAQEELYEKIDSILGK